MRRGDHATQVVERAEDRVDVAVVRDVVAEVRHRRAEHRREPDRVDAEIAQVGKTLGDAGQIAHAVAVAVGEGARVDLVDDGAPPPRGILLRCHRFPPLTGAPPGASSTFCMAKAA